MEWLIVGAIAAVGAVAAVVSYNQNKDELEYQKKQAALTNAANNSDSLISALGQIQQGQDRIDQYLNDIDSLQSLVTSDQEYIGIYEDILAGDRTGSEEARNLATLENNIDIASSNIEAYQKQQQLAEKNAQNYLKEASISKKEAVDTGLQSYSELMKQRSLSNLYASASGAIKSSYSSSALKYENQLMEYIGVDMKFNSEGGSFVDKYILLENQISAQIFSNNEQIRLLSESVDQAEMKKEKAQGDLDTQMEKYESQYDLITGENGSLASNTKAIRRARLNIALNRAIIQMWKNNAINSLKDYRENAKNAGISEAEINENINGIKNPYLDADIDEEMKSIIEDIFK